MAKKPLKVHYSISKLRTLCLRGVKRAPFVWTLERRAEVTCKACIKGLAKPSLLVGITLWAKNTPTTTQPTTLQ